VENENEKSGDNRPVRIFTDGETWVFARTTEEAYKLEREAVGNEAVLEKWEEVPPGQTVSAGMAECGLHPRNLPKILPNENFDFVPVKADIRAIAKAQDWVDRHLETGGAVPAHFLSVYI